MNVGVAILTVVLMPAVTRAKMKDSRRINMRVSSILRNWWGFDDDSRETEEL
jgi:hypothetical protein